MADMQSPLDPIFWLHHANIDRLWSAWVAANNGRKMPVRTNSYWSGNFTYATGLTLKRTSTIDTRSDMGYFYQNELMPVTLPPSAMIKPIQLAMADTDENIATLGLLGARVMNQLPERPPFGNFLLSDVKSTGVNRLSITGIKKLSLNEVSISAHMPIDVQGSKMMESIFKKFEASPFGNVDNSSKPYTSIQIVLDNLQITPSGVSGGYFYKMYLNLPSDKNVADKEEKYFLGNFGAFQLSAAKHHNHMTGNSGVRLAFPATELLKNITNDNFEEITISFIRVDGNNSPTGEVITIGECRIEISTDDPE